MIAHREAHRVLRQRLRTLVVCTTGTTTLEATATGYARASGSFLTDGFAVGMEVTPSGFPQTAVGRITAVTALTMTIHGGRTVATAAGSRSLSVGLPAAVAWTNVDFTPTAETPYVEEEYLAGGGAMLTLGQGGTLDLTPTYVVRVYAPLRTGPEALHAYTDALLAHFAPGTALLVGTDTLRVRADVTPSVTPSRRTDDGFAVQTVTIPLRYHPQNPA